jgi:hypothetical protein
VVGPQRRGRVVHVRREPTCYWQDRGWRRQRDIYSGYFAFNGRHWPGQIAWRPDGLRGCLIASPPTEVLQGGHGSCFTPKGEGVYAVHFSRRPETVDAAILEVEKVVRQALGSRR